MDDVAPPRSPSRIVCSLWLILSEQEWVTSRERRSRKLKTLLNRLDKLSKIILQHKAKLAESKRRD